MEPVIPWVAPETEAWRPARAPWPHPGPGPAPARSGARGGREVTGAGSSVAHRSRLPCLSSFARNRAADTEAVPTVTARPPQVTFPLGGLGGGR